VDVHQNSLRARLDAAEKELENIKLRNLANAIKQICDECGHTNTEDGCAFCIKKANAELVKDGVHVFLDDRVTPILMSAIRLYTSKLDLNSPHGRYENAFCIDLLAHLNAAIKDQAIDAAITKGTQ
jgi:hypothetical protein